MKRSECRVRWTRTGGMGDTRKINERGDYSEGGVRFNCRMELHVSGGTYFAGTRLIENKKISRHLCVRVERINIISYNFNIRVHDLALDDKLAYTSTPVVVVVVGGLDRGQ